jgi:hypothetical protein
VSRSRSTSVKAQGGTAAQLGRTGGQVELVEGHFEQVGGQGQTQGLGGLRLHLDHVFSTPEIDWIDAEESHSWGEGRFQNLSDHVPKLCRFRLGR